MIEQLQNQELGVQVFLLLLQTELPVFVDVEVEIPPHSSVGIFGHVKEDTVGLLVDEGGLPPKVGVVGKHMENHASIGEGLAGVPEGQKLKE